MTIAHWLTIIGTIVAAFVAVAMALLRRQEQIRVEEAEKRVTLLKEAVSENGSSLKSAGEAITALKLEHVEFKAALKAHGETLARIEKMIAPHTHALGGRRR